MVACWGNQMLDTYIEYLCDLFPQVEFEFVLATNSTDYYRFRQDHDDMPDILMQRLVEEGGQLEAPTDYITLR